MQRVAPQTEASRALQGRASLVGTESSELQSKAAGVLQKAPSKCWYL